jgi:hypothetical protein
MGAELGYGKSQIYGATTIGLLIAALAAYPIGSAIDRGRGLPVMVVGRWQAACCCSAGPGWTACPPST